MRNNGYQIISPISQALNACKRMEELEREHYDISSSISNLVNSAVSNILTSSSHSGSKDIRVKIDDMDIKINITINRD